MIIGSPARRLRSVTEGVAFTLYVHWHTGPYFADQQVEQRHEDPLMEHMCSWSLSQQAESPITH